MRGGELHEKLTDCLSFSIGYWWESQKERDHNEDQDVSGWIILKRILDRYGLDLSGLG
jgi:hypothetical protein